MHPLGAREARGLGCLLSLRPTLRLLCSALLCGGRELRSHPGRPNPPNSPHQRDLVWVGLSRDTGRRLEGEGEARIFLPCPLGPGPCMALAGLLGPSGLQHSLDSGNSTSSFCAPSLGVVVASSCCQFWGCLSSSLWLLGRPITWRANSLR